MQPVQHLFETGAAPEMLATLRKILDNLVPAHIQIAANVLQPPFSGDGIQIDQATARQPGEAVLDLPVYAGRWLTAQRAVAIRKPELAMLGRDEIEDRQMGLFLVEPQTPTDLLQIDREALRGAQQENGVHLGNIDPFVVEIDGKDKTDPALHEIPLGFPAPVLAAVGREGLGREVPFREYPRHEPGMLLADAESNPADASRIGHSLQYLTVHPLRPHLVRAEYPVQLGLTVSAALPVEMREIDRVVIGYPEVVKRGEQTPLDGIRQANFVGIATTEVLADITAVGPLGRGRQAEQDPRADMFQDGPIACRRRVVRLVQHDVIELLPVEPFTSQSARSVLASSF